MSFEASGRDCSRSAGASGHDGSCSAVLLLLLVGIGMIVNAGGVVQCQNAVMVQAKMTDLGCFETKQAAYSGQPPLRPMVG